MSEGKQKVGESSSGEVDNGFWSCRDLTDVVPLHTPRGLYLKPIAKINVSVNLPRLKTPGKTISIWEVMEKIRGLVQPDEFTSLKVAKSTLEFIRLEGDLSDRCRLHRVLARLDSQRLNLAGFPNVLKVRVAEAKDDFPTRHSWDSYFRDAKHMNELKPGERPDTIHITGLPVKWFSEDGGNTPSEAIVSRVFKKWGPLRRVDVPASDVYRSRMRLSNNIQKFSFGDGVFFDAYVQYVEYMDFVKAMDALRGMKLLKKEAKTCLTALIKVDFDKSKHMSDSSVSHRAFERKRLIAQDSLAAEKLRKKEELEAQKKEETKKKEEADMQEKEAKRQKREEKRKIRVFRRQEEDKVSVKIAREEQKLIKAQRQLESIRLLDELFDRIKIKVEKKEIVLGVKTETGGKAGGKSGHKKTDKTNDQDPHKSNDKDSEKKSDKKSKKLKKKKSKKEKKKKEKDTRSGSSTDQSDSETAKKKIKSVLTVNNVQPSSSAAVAPLDPGLGFASMYPRFPQAWYYDLPMIYPSMGRGGVPRGGMLNRFHRGRGRGYGFRRGNIRGAMRTFNPHIYNEQYYKYFANLAGQDYSDYETDYDDRSSRSRSRVRSKSRSRTRVRSKSRSRTRGRSKSHSRTRGRSKSRSHSRGRSKSHSRTRGRSKSRSRGRTKSRSRTRGRSKSRSRTRERSKSRTRGRSKSRSGACTRSRSRSRKRGRRRRRSSSSSASRSGSRSRRARGGRSFTSSRSSSRSRRWRSNNKRSRTKSRSPEAGRNRKGRRKRSRSRVMITRARSRSVSGKRRSQSSSWSMPKSSHQRSCSW